MRPLSGGSVPTTKNIAEPSGRILFEEFGELNHLSTRLALDFPYL
jgi:hypothetical protein